MTRNVVIQMLILRKGERTQVELATDLGVSAQYLGDVLAGRRDPGKAILNAMGLEKIVDYRQKQRRKAK